MSDDLEESRGQATLREEIEELRARLDEAEQTLAAIRCGEVDALVVAGPKGEQLYTLSGAERVYRVIVESMHEAALTVGESGTILFCNERFCTLLRLPMERALGRDVMEFVALPQQEPLRAFLAEARTRPANRRLVLPEAFLAADALLLIWRSVARGLEVHPAMIRSNLDLELPFMASEEILLAAAARGGDRQRLHEKLRQLARTAGHRVKDEGEPNPLLDLVAENADFGLTREMLTELVDAAHYVGLAPEQVDDFLTTIVTPWLTAHPITVAGEEPEV